jgi:hypothetical protein
MPEKLALTRSQVEKIRHLAFREQLRCDAVVKILTALKTRDLWQDEEKCLPRSFGGKTRDEKLACLPEYESLVSEYRSIAESFADLLK